MNPTHCFNTQPPEGGWHGYTVTASDADEFQHTAARRRLGKMVLQHAYPYWVSTHSRPKAAGADYSAFAFARQFQHTAARRRLDLKNVLENLSKGFNTQPPEGGWKRDNIGFVEMLLFQHTAARRRLGRCRWRQVSSAGFQHTAARRRLGVFGDSWGD